MKRFFMYCIVIIGTLFVGLSFYMFAKNNEVIDCTVPQGETVYLNVGESFDIPINHTKPNKRTTIETKSDNSNVAAINAESGKIEAKAGGTATINITPSNKNFGPFVFTVRIGDGSTDNPYFISSAEQMLRIGAMDTLWTLGDSYEVVSNIDFKETWVDGKATSWKPIGDRDNHFTGNFNGGTKTISNLIIDETCTSDYVGLFGYVESGAKIEKVTLVNPQIKVTGKNVGSIAGYSESAITRCKVVNGVVSSSNTSADAYVGGIVGVATRTQTENEIAMCQIENVALNSGNVVGGIAGKFESGVIANCKVGATIANNKDVKPNYAGGLVGEISAKNFTQNVGTAKTFTYNSLIQTNLVIATFGKDGEAYNATNNNILIANDSLSGDSATEYVGNVFYSDAFDSTNATKFTRQEIDDQNKYQYTNKYSKVVSWDFSGTWSFDGKTETDSMGPYIVQDGVGQTIRPLRNGTEINKANAADVIGQLMEAGKSDSTSSVLNYTLMLFPKMLKLMLKKHSQQVGLQLATLNVHSVEQYMVLMVQKSHSKMLLFQLQTLLHMQQKEQGTLKKQQEFLAAHHQVHQFQMLKFLTLSLTPMTAHMLAVLLEKIMEFWTIQKFLDFASKMDNMLVALSDIMAVNLLIVLLKQMTTSRKSQKDKQKKLHSTQRFMQMENQLDLLAVLLDSMQNQSIAAKQTLLLKEFQQKTEAMLVVSLDKTQQAQM